MSLRVRRTVVGVAIGVVLLLASASVIVAWLDWSGLTAFAASLRREYLTGTAITVILVVMFLNAPGPGFPGRRCRACDAVHIRNGRYCATCGSRV